MMKTIPNLSRTTAGTLRATLFVVPLTLASAAQAPAATVSTVTDYSITLSGISLAKASFSTSVDGKRFDIRGRFSTTGLVRLFRRVEGTAKASGKVSGAGLVAEKYNSEYVSGNSKKRYEINFSRGGVKSFVADPDMKNPPENWIAVSKQDLARAVDPLTGLILPGDKDPCSGTVPVFDGEARTDLLLAAKGTGVYKAGGNSVPVLMCGLKITPVSGFRKGKGDMDYAAKLKGMEIWFAKSPDGRLYAPVMIKAPTGFGTVKIAATRFGA